jgi:hypothetical protein
MLNKKKTMYESSVTKRRCFCLKTTPTNQHSGSGHRRFFSYCMCNYAFSIKKNEFPGDFTVIYYRKTYTVYYECTLSFPYLRECCKDGSENKKVQFKGTSDFPRTFDTAHNFCKLLNNYICGLETIFGTVFVDSEWHIETFRKKKNPEI